LASLLNEKAINAPGTLTDSSTGIGAAGATITFTGTGATTGLPPGGGNERSWNIYIRI
jgi:hypothetical protein